MPPRTPKACRQRGCPGVSIVAHGYCEQHADKAKAWTGGGAGRGRGGRPWRRIRERIKKRASGLCESCSKVGIVSVGAICDHRIPKAEGGTDRDNNLQWLCRKCSDKKTQQESLRARQRHT